MYVGRDFTEWRQYIRTNTLLRQIVFIRISNIGKLFRTLETWNKYLFQWTSEHKFYVIWHHQLHNLRQFCFIFPLKLWLLRKSIISLLFKRSFMNIANRRHIYINVK